MVVTQVATTIPVSRSNRRSTPSNRRSIPTSGPSKLAVEAFESSVDTVQALVHPIEGTFDVGDTQLQVDARALTTPSRIYNALQSRPWDEMSGGIPDLAAADV